MNARHFYTLTQIERKAKLIQTLIRRTNRLTKEQLETIANYQWVLYCRDGSIYETFPLIEVQMKINVTTDPRKFAECATLQNRGIEHSWAGDDTVISYGNWLAGKGNFGLYKHKIYSRNGDCGSPTVENREPDFNIDKPQVIVVKTVSHDSLNNDSSLTETLWDLHIYTGNGTFKIDPVINRIIQEFNLTNEK